MTNLDNTVCMRALGALDDGGLIPLNPIGGMLAAGLLAVAVVALFLGALVELAARRLWGLL